MKFLTILFFSLSSLSFSDDLVNDIDGVALDGYDVVAYFDNAKKGLAEGTKGLNSIEAEYKGVKYHFANEKNKEIFLKRPEDYLPAYGGWCAWAVAQGQNEVSVNYDSFIVKKDKDGKERLFLFYKTWLTNTQKKWSKGSHNDLEQIADKNWADFVKK